jgi:hypothetical protein
MEDEIVDDFNGPDDFEGFDQKTRILVLKQFFFESEAHIYAARLREAGIRCEIASATIQTMLPVEQAGIKLLIRESDLEEATQIVAVMDRQKEMVPEGPFHDIDKEEIVYLQEVEKDKKGNRNLLWIALFILVILILRAFLRGAGLIDSRWDFF